MRKILWILSVLIITQGVYAMENDEQIALKIQSIKFQQSFFESKSLEEQQQMLISALNVYYEAKERAQFSICMNLGRPLVEYEGFDQIKKGFTLNAYLQFSGKTLPIKDISREDLNPLITYLVNKSALLSFKKKLLRNSNFLFLHAVYEEELKKNRHELLLNVYRVTSEYSVAKKTFKSYAMEEISKYSIIQEVFKNHSMAERTSAFNGRMLECRVLPKDYTANKEGELQEILEKRKEFQKILNKEEKIKDIFRNIIKNGIHLNIWCLTKELIKAPNEFCNSNCALTAFVDFSIEDLFKFYEVSFHKLHELHKINESYINKRPLLSPVLQSNAPYYSPQKTPYNTQEKTSDVPPQKTYRHLVLFPLKSSPPTQERLRKKLQSQKEKTEVKENKKIIKQEENCNKEAKTDPLITISTEEIPHNIHKENVQEKENKSVMKQKENSTEEVKKDPLIIPSIEEIPHNNLEGITPRDGYKKSYPQKKGKQGKGKNGGGEKEKPNVKKPDSSQKQPLKKETVQKKQSILPSPIMVNMQGGGTAARGASRPSDGQEEGFRPQFVKKPPQKEYGPLKETRKPIPIRNPQNKPQTKGQYKDPPPSSKPGLLGNSPHRVVVTSHTRPSKNQLYVQVLQNLTLPETEQLAGSREKAAEEKVQPEKKENGDKKNEIFNKPTIPNAEERNSDNLNSETFIDSNKNLTISSEQQKSLPVFKQNQIATQAPEVQTDKAPIGQTTTLILKQPQSLVIFPSKEYRIEDHPSIAKILIQNNIMHVYTHEREEAEIVMTKYRIALESEKRAREASDQEIVELKQQIAELNQQIASLIK